MLDLYKTIGNEATGVLHLNSSRLNGLIGWLLFL